MSDLEGRIVVMYPDLSGAELAAGGFADGLLRHHRNVLALVNGPEPGLLDPPQRDDVTVVVSPVRGLAASLRYGYRAAAGLGEVVVRIDAAEHRKDRISVLAAAASDAGGAVGDLTFPPGTLRTGSADEHAQLDVVPALFGRVTGGRIRLSGAHGFQAWRSDILATVLPVAEEMWDMAAADEEMLWAFDAAMILAADLCGLTPVVVGQEATELRDRARGRIAEQYDALLRVALAYLRMRER